MNRDSQVIHNEYVRGISVDRQTRCAHWHGELDVIAMKFKCCGEWFPCFECHSEVADHAAEVWPEAEFAERAILCGLCGNQLEIAEYFSAGSICPQCSGKFNPGCANHYHLYFETTEKPT